MTLTLNQYGRNMGSAHRLHEVNVWHKAQLEFLSLKALAYTPQMAIWLKSAKGHNSKIIHAEWLPLGYARLLNVLSTYEVSSQ